MNSASTGWLAAWLPSGGKTSAKGAGANRHDLNGRSDIFRFEGGREGGRNKGGRGRREEEISRGEGDESSSEEVS